MAESNASKFAGKITSEGKVGQGGLAAGVGSTDWQSVVVADGSTATTAVAGRGYYIDTTSGTHTINLPSSASFGDTIEFVDYSGTAATNTITIGRNGHKINNATSDQTITKNFSGIKLVYVNATVGWRSVSTSNVSDVARVAYNVDYLIVAGGGGGGGGIGGGGGAGGMKTGTIQFNPLTTYTATVGAGGTKSTGTVSGYGTLSIGTNGGDSSLAGSDITTITSTGGGLGGSYHSTSVDQGSDGGSGGGAAALGSGDITIPGGSGTVGQGNDGGDAFAGSAKHGTGGGGGAGAAGEDGVSPGTNAGDGGDGSQSDITGSSVYYAGGGGGGCHEGVTVTGGNGGQGGGGDGGLDASPSNRQSVAGTTNLGGGGGAGRYSSNNDGANGGSGVVILKILTSDYSGSVTGSPTVTTSGSHTIVKFTGTGTYIA